MSRTAKPGGGALLTETTCWLLLVAAMGCGVLFWRFFSGLGATTALNDGHAWGLWIALEVVTGTAIACGGYAVALLVYVFNKGHFHPLVRPALLTSFLGYSLAAVAIVADVGRYWYLYKVVSPWMWNLSSALLEVALCVMSYLIVLFLELSPAFLEQSDQSRSAALRKACEGLRRVLEPLMPFILALGILLPTMHQSSLGSVMLIAFSKLHALWHTPLLPLLFLLSCVAMGYAAVILESSLASRAFSRPRETELLAKLATPVVVCVVLYTVIRIGDLAMRDRLPLIARSGHLSLFFVLELLLFVVPAVMLLSGRIRRNPGTLFLGAVLLMAAGTLYRFDTYIIAFDPGPAWSYFPAVPEILASAGIIVLEILLYVIVVKRFPILESAALQAGGKKE